MTVTAVSPQARAGTGTAPARTAGAQGAKSAPPVAAPPAPRRRQIALTPMRSDTAKSLRRLAAHVQGSHPDMSVHAHLRDAAKVLESGNEEGAQRHLRAAMFALTPQSLLRNGVRDDPGHLAAREAMHGVHRHLLLVKDIQDAGEKNRAAIAKHATEDMTTSPPPPAYGGDPGALAQRPVARQPGGDRALNAPARTNSGGSDPAVADPVGPQPRGSKQFARTWDELALVVELANRPKVVELVGPKGYIHGWIFVGIPGPGQEVFHPHHGHGTVTAVHGNHVTVAFDAGHSKAFPVRSHPGPGHFEQMTDEEVANEYGSAKGSRAAAALGEMDRRDRQDQEAKSGRVKALYAEKPKTEADRNRVYQGLVNEGENPEDAWQHAHGTNADDMQKQAVVQQLRAEGHKGAGFDALTRSAYKEEVRRRVDSAEAATNGYMLNKAAKRAGIDPKTLFTGPESRARKYASPELKEWFDQNGRPTAADFQANLLGKPVTAGPHGGDFYASVTWDDLASVIELSARTAALEVTPAPRGKPGGPGLYDVKGQKHSDYMEQVVKALIEKRGMPPGKAYAIAWGALRKWRAKSKHPEVRAAAAGSLAEEATKHGSHGHATSWDDIGKVIEMAAVPTWDDVASVIEMAAAAAVPGQQIAAGQPAAAAKQPASPAKSANATAQARVGAGSPAGGQFAPAGGGGGSSSKKPADAHQQHVAHLQHLATHGTPAQQQAAKALLARMAAPSKSKTTSKSSATPKTASTAAAKPAGSTKTTTAKTSASKTTAKAAAGKAPASKTASTKANATAHQQHAAHVTHLQHLATHGNPVQRKAAAAVLARMGVKP